MGENDKRAGSMRERFFCDPATVVAGPERRGVERRRRGVEGAPKKRGAAPGRAPLPSNRSPFLTGVLAASGVAHCAAVMVADALTLCPDGTTTSIGFAWVATGSVVNVSPAGPVK